MGLLERLQEQVFELQTKVAELEGRRIPCDTTEDKPKKPSRDVVVEMAKTDVKELGERLPFSDVLHYRVETPNGIRGCSVKFIVNKEKRTVVALMKGMGSGKLRAKGIAKCAPNDCFNSHIGKAIALRRALRLEVPEEYTDAPQPTEVRVGDVVTGNQTPGYYSPDKQFKLTGINEEDGGFYHSVLEGDWIFESQIGKVIDDSRDGVGE